MQLPAARADKTALPQAATVIAINSAVTNKKTGAKSGETRLFVPSLERAALTPHQRLARVRGH